MKIIERYLSAYVVGCMFGFTDEKHRDYVFEVLRETNSNIRHPLLRQVMDFIRQSDPADPKTQEEIRQYCVAMALRPDSEIKEEQPEYEGRYSIHRGYMFIQLTHKGQHVGVLVGTPIT